MTTCPNCGYCPHCGRSSQPYQTYPYQPVPYITWTSGANTLIGTHTISNAPLYPYTTTAATPFTRGATTSKL